MNVHSAPSARYLEKIVSFGLCSRLLRDRRTSSTSRKLYITSLHSIKFFSLLALRAFLNHAISMRQLAAENITKNLRISVRVCRKSCLRCDAVFVENTQRSKTHMRWIIVVCKAECVVGIQPAVIWVAASRRAAWDDGCVWEFGHCGFDCVCCTWCWRNGHRWLFRSLLKRFEYVVL